MKPVRVVVVAVFLAVSVAVVGVAIKAQAPGSRTDEDAIKAVIAATTDAFNTHDAGVYARLATPDAQFVTVRGETMNGIAEIAKGLTALFQTRNKNATLKTLGVTVRSIRPDVALSHVTNEISGVVTAEGERLPPHRELSLRVFVKDGGVWRMTAFHNTTLQR